MNIQRKLHLLALRGSIKAEKFSCLFLLLIDDLGLFVCFFQFILLQRSYLALCKGLRFQLCLETSKGHVSHSCPALNSWLFGEAVAHAVSLSVCFLFLLLWLLAITLSYFKSLAVLLKERVSKVFEAEECFWKWHVVFPVFILHVLKAWVAGSSLYQKWYKYDCSLLNALCYACFPWNWDF